ncbi:regulator [Streptomyces sp. NPDC051940]|uniref:ATP-binding protein n=1 Tax=Streptomyces sp. NPDC051940 TaxID=3155675 RepID=UPI003412B3A9
MRRNRRLPHDGSAPRPPGNLPAELSRFIGRRSELGLLGEALERARLVTVTGVGGVGKSRLALRAAAELAGRYPDGVWLLEVSELSGGDGLVHAALDVFGLADAGGAPPLRLLTHRLSGRRALLVLDSCEHADAECARLTAELLRKAPGLRVLATSRRPLDIDGERLFPLAPLPADAPGSDAVRLFTDRARTVVPGFDPAGAKAAAVAELCRRLDGIPLALELAAGRLRSLSPDQLSQRLDDRFRLLVSGGRGGTARHQTLRTAIGWSHELCTPRERLLWARLSVFTGDFGLDAAEYVCADDSLEVADLASVLGQLVSQSVVLREEWQGGVRFRMLDTVREYGAQWLGTLRETERLRDRHRDWYLGVAIWCELDWFGPRQSEVPEQIERELPNLRLALEHCLRRPEDAHLGQQLASTLWFYWMGCGRLSEGRAWLGRVLAARTTQPAPRARALWVTAFLAVIAGDPVAAKDAAAEGAELAEISGDEVAQAHVRQMLGIAYAISDDMPQAVALLRDAVRRLRELGRLDSLALLAQVQLGQCLAFAGETNEATALLHEAHDLAVESGELWARSYALYAWAYTLWRRGSAVRALELNLECLAIKRVFRDAIGMTMTLEHIAPLVARTDPGFAARIHGGAEAGWQSFGTKRFGSAHFDLPHLECERLAREALGDEGYLRAVATGRHQGLAAVVDELLSSPAAPRPESGVPAARGR